MASRKEPVKIRGVYEREKGSGVWWICYKQGTVRKREKVGSRGKAITLYQQRKTELRAGAKLPSNMRHKGITFGELALEAQQWSEEFHPKDIRTVKSRMKVLIEEFGLMAASDVSPQQIDLWLTAHPDWAPATKNRYRALLSLVYRQAMRSGKAASNPARLVAARAENNKRIRYLLDDEERALRKAIKTRCECYLPSLDIALYSGMRLSEQFSLTWDCVDLEGKKILLDETKNGSKRDIPMHPECLKAFLVLDAIPHGKMDRVFRAPSGRPLNTPRKWFASVLADAGVTGFRWHDLRHSFCSRLAMAGVDVLYIAKLAGHKTLSMSQRYSHLSPSSSQSAIERLVQVR